YSSRRRHTRSDRDWSSDVCSSDLASAIFAGLTAAFASIPLYREWGRIAVVPYVLGLAAAIALASRGPSMRARAWVAALVFLGAEIGRASCRGRASMSV